MTTAPSPFQNQRPVTAADGTGLRQVGRRRAVPIEAEEGLLSAIIADPTTYVAVCDDVTWNHFGAPKPRNVAWAIWECVSRHETITRANIAARLVEKDKWETGEKDSVDMRYLVQLDDAGIAAEIVAAPQYARRIKVYANSRWRAKLAREYAEAMEERPDDGESTTAEFMQRMNNSMRNQHARTSSAADIRAARDSRVGQIAAGVPCGLKLFDNMIGGFKPSRIWTLAARFKGRKTTIAKQLALYAVRSGMPVSFFMTADGTKEDLYNGFVAMLATAWMRNNGVPDSEWTIKAEGLAVSSRTPAQHQGIQWAEAELDGYPLYLYDSRDGIRDLDALCNIAHGDITLRGTGLYVVDYATNVKPARQRDNAFKAYEQTVETLDELTRTDQVTALILSQMNQESIRGAQFARRNGGNTADDVTQSKMGPKLQEASDHYITLEYDELRTPSKIKMFHRLSRWTAPFQVEYEMEINSGLILNTTYIPTGIHPPEHL